MHRVIRALAAIAAGVLLMWVFAATPHGSTGTEPAVAQPNPPTQAEPRAVGLRTEGAVPQAQPIWMSIEPGLLAQTMLNPDGVRAVGGVVNPVDNRPAFRTDSNLPGTDSPGTTFIVGHNYAVPAGGVMPFAALARVRIGDAVLVGTDSGTLVYSVRDVFRVPKEQLAGRTDLLENVAGRLILETCDTTVDGRDTTDNLVVVTQLAT